MSPTHPLFSDSPASPQSFGSQSQILPNRHSAVSVYSNSAEDSPARGMVNYSDLAAHSSGEVDGYDTGVAGYEPTPPMPFANSTPRLSTSSSGNVNRSVQGQSRYAAAGYAEKARMTERSSGNWNGEKGSPAGFSAARGAGAGGSNRKKWIIGAVVAACVVIAVAVGAGVGVTQSHKSSSSAVANAASAGADSSSSPASAATAASASASSAAAAASAAASASADPSASADDGAPSQSAAPTAAAVSSETPTSAPAAAAATSAGLQYSTDGDGDIYTLSTADGYSTWEWYTYGADTAAAAEATADSGDGDSSDFRRRRLGRRSRHRN